MSHHSATISDEGPPESGPRQLRVLLERDVRVCAAMLDEARRLVRMGQNGTVFVQFVHCAGQVLDEMRELQVALSPAQDAVLIKRIADLQRTIESVRLSMPETRQMRGVGPSAAG